MHWLAPLLLVPTLAVPALPVLPGLPAWPDILPPGHKAVEHVLVLEVAPALAGAQLWAFPTRGFAGAQRIVPGEPFAFSSKYGTRIHLLGAGEPWPPAGEPSGWGDALPDHPSGIPCREVASVPVSSPVARIESRFRLEGAAGAELRFTPLGERRFDRRGRELSAAMLWPWLAGIALLGLAGLLWLGRRGAAGA